MATMMPPAAPAPIDPAASEEPAESAGFVIEIKCMPGQPIVVSAKPIDPVEQGEEGAEMDGMSGQPAQDWKSAMAVATQLYRNDGQMSGASADEQAGFDSVSKLTGGM